MLFLDIFDDMGRVLVTYGAFLALGYALWTMRASKCFVALSCFVGALLLMSGLAAVQSFEAVFLENGASVQLLSLIEMLIVLCLTALLIVSGTQMCAPKTLGLGSIFLFISLGLILTLYVIFVPDQGYLLSQMQLLLPLIGMIGVVLSLAAQIGFPTRLAPLGASVCTAGLALLIALPTYFQVIYPWYLPADLIFALAFFVYRMSVEDMQRELQRLQRIQTKTTANIENIVRSSPFPIMISRLSDDRLMMANRNAVKLFGLNESELPRYRFKDFFVDTENRKLLTDRLEKTQEVQNFEILVRSVAGQTPFWLLVSANIVDYENDVVLYTAFQNITDRKRREDMLQTQAYRDPLTSVFNRRYFETRLPEKIMLARRAKKPFALLMLDADHFKRVNDTYGHKIGDKVLMELAAVCERQLRADDLVARYGGEEFVVYLDNVMPDAAVMVANRLREAVKSAVVYTENQERVDFTVSIGVAPSGISDMGDLMIKMADDAMYLAKQSGRDRVELYAREKVESAQTDQHWQNTRANQPHPAYTDAEDEPISLLDGIESQHMMKD